MTAGRRVDDCGRAAAPAGSGRRRARARGPCRLGHPRRGRAHVRGAHHRRGARARHARARPPRFRVRRGRRPRALPGPRGPQADGVARPGRDRRLARRGARCGVRRHLRPVRRRRRPDRERDRRARRLVARVHARPTEPWPPMPMRPSSPTPPDMRGRSPPTPSVASAPRGWRPSRSSARARRRPRSSPRPSPGCRPGRRRDARPWAAQAPAPGQHRADGAASRADVGPDRPAECESAREVSAPRSSRWRRSRPRRLRGCGSCQRRRPSPPSAPATRSTSTARPRRRRCCSTRSSPARPSCTTSGSSTSTSRAPARTWPRRWPATSATGRCSSGRTRARRSTRAAPTTSRSSCPTSRTSSTPARSRSTPSSSTPPRPTRTASARSAPPWRPCTRPSAPRRRSSRSSTGRCRGRSATASSTSTTSTSPSRSTSPRTSTRPARSARSSGASASTSPTLVPDGATLQLGIGAIPAATALALHGQARPRRSTPRCSPTRSSTWSRPGSSPGARKELNRGKIVTAFLMGTQRLYDFVDDNPMVEMRPVDFTNDTARHPLVQADDRDQLGDRGRPDRPGRGRLDRASPVHRRRRPDGLHPRRGARARGPGDHRAAVDGGRGHGLADRRSALQEGAGVVTTRAHVRTVVTEWGVAELFGKSLRERAQALIAIAHPDLRDELTAGARRYHLI